MAASDKGSRIGNSSSSRKVDVDNPCPIFLLDGGLGTTLVDDHGCVFDDSTPLWSSQLLLTVPLTLLEVQRAFTEAGADVILTATYQASFEGFARSGVDEVDAARVMRSAVEIGRAAAAGVRGGDEGEKKEEEEEEKEKKGGKNGRGKGKGKGKTALGLGAYGATMIPGQEYSGKYDEDHVTSSQLREWHRRRLDVFLPEKGDGQAEEEEEEEEEEGSGKREGEGKGEGECWENVDLVAFETLPRIEEVQAVREVMASVPHTLMREFWISCVFPGEKNLLPDGSTVKDVVDAMLGKRDGSAVPMGIGINCTRVGKVDGLIREFEEAVRKLVDAGETEKWPALVFYPDGTMGEVYNTTTKEWEKGQVDVPVGCWDETISDIVGRTRERGLWKSIFVGGCCKTTPADIGKLRARIDKII